MKKDLLSPQFLRTGSAWFFLILGIGLYIVGYFLIDRDSIWKEIIIKFGDIFVIGVILGYLTNVAQLAGIFKSDLENIIYAKEFIKKRNDLPAIWENVTKELFKSKFPAISKELLSLIQSSYLPVDNVSYYNDYNIMIDLNWGDKDKKTVIVRSVINFDLIAETKDKFEFPLRSWIDIEGVEKDDYYVKVSDYFVNNKPAEFVDEIETTKGGVHEYSYIISLGGETKYEISKIVEKKYNLNKDFTVCFKAQFLINKLSIQFTHPDDIAACFTNRGTIKGFKEINRKSNSFSMKYKELILPNQGYVISLKEKES